MVTIKESPAKNGIVLKSITEIIAVFSSFSFFKNKYNKTETNILIIILPNLTPNPVFPNIIILDFIKKAIPAPWSKKPNGKCFVHNA